jgi:LPXTG-motif cell wall-anchored protein
MTSPDGITWTARAAEANFWQAVAAGDGYFMAIAASGTNRLMVSTDGATWLPLAGADVGGNWESITYGNNVFVGVANVGSVLVVRASIPVVAATTTTTAPTTTIATTTTVTPTTVATTTTVTAEATTEKAATSGLPATGTNNNQLALVALLFVVAGSTLLVRRRVR